MAWCSGSALPPSTRFALNLGAQLLGCRDLRSIPAATQRFHQLDAGHDLLFSKTNGSFLSRQQRGLGGDDVEVRIDSGFVPDFGFVEASFRRLDRGILLLDNLRQDSESGQVVLDLLEGGQHGLPVIRHGLVISGLELLHGGPAQSGVEDGLGEARTDGPQPARPGEPFGGSDAFESSDALKVTLGKNAACATPICALACATARSAAAMSGRRSNNSDGTPAGISGGVVSMNLAVTENSDGGWPANTAMACSY